MSDLYQFAILMGVAILYCAPEGARGSFGEGTPSKITQYILRNYISSIPNSGPEEAIL